VSTRRTHVGRTLGTRRVQDSNLRRSLGLGVKGSELGV
jgi:hypothetical protein